jgi:PIN domain nuclease of toxin-antitoxin system
MWTDSAPSRLSAEVSSLIRDSDTVIFLSLVSVWEIQIKHQIGKLAIAMPLANIVERQQRENQIMVLPITLSHILEIDNLPMHHRDPFDRMLIAQASVEGLTLLRDDTALAQYPVQVVW